MKKGPAESINFSNFENIINFTGRFIALLWWKFYTS